MIVRTETRKIYITEDGTEFFKRKEADEHELACRVLEMFEPLVVSPSGFENLEARRAATEIVMKNLEMLRTLLDNDRFIGTRG